MIIVGINLGSTIFDKYLKDGGVCVVADGNIKFAIAEERINRKKRSGGHRNALLYALQQLSIEKTDIDLFVYSSCCEEVRSAYQIPDFEGIKTLPCNHHKSHALSVYFTSPFDEAVIIVLDAGGNLSVPEDARNWWLSEREQHSYFIARENEVRLHSVDFKKPKDAGIAEVYRAFTHYLGWPSSSYANKVMALSAFGDPTTFVNKEIFTLSDEGVMRSCINNDPLNPISMIANLMQRYSVGGLQPRLENDAIQQFHCNLASWIQKETEKAIFQKIDYLIKKTGIANVCLAGGVAYNCSLIGKILDNTMAKRIFVQPASGDHGQCLGNAIYGHLANVRKWPRSYLFNPYLGGEQKISLQKINNHMGDKPFLQVREYNDLPCEIAKLLAANEIVAWFQGRSEYGPRALGNRSILASPCNPLLGEKLNIIKGRERFMPFAPAVLVEKANEIFEVSTESPYMTAAYKVRKDKSKLIPSVVHMDTTSRIQTVRKDSNPLFHEVISRFYNLTGIPLILNTSFNGPGEPIVETLNDALDTFMKLNIRYLAAGNFLIEKKEVNSDIIQICVNEDNHFIYSIYDDSILKIRERLYIRFPFTPLIPRERFGLYYEYVDWLKTGRKVTTIRFKKEGIEYPLKKIVPLFETDSYKHAAKERYIGNVNLTQYRVKKFKDLNSQDAINDGFDSINELRTVLKEIFTKLTDNDYVSIYSINFINERNLSNNEA